MSAEKVAAAAKFLDNFGPLDWRSRIDVSKLRMSSMTTCVLGQVYGHYDIGAQKLRDAAGWSEWEAIEIAFETFKPHWIEYLNNNKDKFAKGAEWVNKMDDWFTMVISHVFHDDNGIRQVVFSRKGSTDYSIRTVDNFESIYKPKPKKAEYVEGQLYRAKSNKDRIVLMYGANIYSNGPGFYFLNDDSYCGVKYFEDIYGELIPLHAVKNVGASIIAKIG